MNKGTSVWDCMHPSELATGNSEPRAQIYSKPPSGKPDSRNQRRDPIGYFEDTNKYATNNLPMVPKSASKQYTPSWSNGYAKDEPTMEGSRAAYGSHYGSTVNTTNHVANESDYANSNDLLDQAMLSAAGQYNPQALSGY